MTMLRKLRTAWLFRCAGLALVLAAVGCLVLWAQADRVLPAAARWLDVGTPPARVDAVFILPGDQSVRPVVAAALVKAGYAERALFPQNAPSPETIAAGRLPTEVLIPRVLELRGLTPAQIVMLAGETISTEDDLRTLGVYLREHPQDQVAVVTSHYHTRRTRLLVQRLLGPDAPRVSYVSAPTCRFDADNWWRRDDGFFAVTSEYLKLAYCRLRYLRLWGAGGKR